MVDKSERLSYLTTEFNHRGQEAEKRALRQGKGVFLEERIIICQYPFLLV